MNKYSAKLSSLFRFWAVTIVFQQTLQYLVTGENDFGMAFYMFYGAVIQMSWEFFNQPRPPRPRLQDARMA